MQRHTMLGYELVRGIDGMDIASLAVRAHGDDYRADAPTASSTPPAVALFCRSLRLSPRNEKIRLR